MVALLRRLLSLAEQGRRKRLLRVCDTIGLGEKRFVAVVECGRQRFLVAGTSQNIALLQRLDDVTENTDGESRRGFMRE